MNLDVTEYEMGNAALFTNLFEALDDGVLVPTDPTTVQLGYRMPGVAEEDTIWDTYGEPGSIIARDGVGSYSALVPLALPVGDMQGVGHERWVADGNIAGSKTRRFLVTRSPVPLPSEL